MGATRGQGNPDWTRDETILALDLLLRHWPRIPPKQDPEVIALSELIRNLPFHRDSTNKNVRFRNSDGVYMKLHNLAGLHPDKKGKGLANSKMDRAVWDDYASKPELVRKLAQEIAKGIKIINAVDSIDIDDADDVEMEAPEGKVLSGVHKRRERHKGFRKKIIDGAIKSTSGVHCKACGVSTTTPDKIGYFMFEVHHIVPLSLVATTKTTLKDLALMCANCHRQIHAAMRVNKRHYTIDEFQNYLKSNASNTMQKSR